MLAQIEELQRALERLPGFGRRSAARAALALVREPARLLEPLKVALAAAQGEIRVCSRCGAFTDRAHDPCETCMDPLRDGSIICVVEEPADSVLMEASGAFRGRYHVLGGKLSPSRRTGPENLRIDALVRRVETERASEVLLALSTDMEGDATAMFVTEKLRPTGVKVSRLAFGLPADSGVAYSDPLTLRRAIQWRHDV